MRFPKISWVTVLIFQTRRDIEQTQKSNQYKIIDPEIWSNWNLAYIKKIAIYEVNKQIMIYTIRPKTFL